MKKLPPEAVEACRPRLVAELEAAKVSTAVVMGNSATRALLRKSEAKRGITKLRVGPPKKITVPRDGGDLDDPHGGDVLDLQAVLTFHPAYCLRSQAMFPLMLGDVNKAIAEKKITRWYEPKIVIVTSTNVHTIIDRIHKLNKGAGIVVDTESGRDKDESFGRDDGIFGRVLCIGIGPTDPTDQDVVYVFPDEVLAHAHTRAKFRDMLNECGIIAQNGKYDIGVLMSFLDQSEPFPLLDDTMLASYSLYEVGGIHGLEYMGQEVLGTPDWKSEVKPYITKEEGYGSIPREILYRYNAFDVHATRILCEYFKVRISEQDLDRIYKFLLRVSHMLTKVEARGIQFDTSVAKRLIEEFDAEIQELEGQLPFNPRSWQQVKAWLSEHNIETESTDEDHLIAIRDHKRTPQIVREKVDLILKARGVSKMKGTYVTGPLEKMTKAGRVHTTFTLCSTTTGRTSSRGPNLQNIPRSGPIKEEFIAAPGKVLIQTDFSQAELRVLTWLAKDEGMRAIFNDPSVDVFVNLCRQLVPGYDMMDAKGQKEFRVLIKTFAYGVSYGRTAAGIAADPKFNMSVAQAQKQMDLFNAQIPAIKEFQRNVVETIHRGEDLVNPFGRHRRFYLITDFNRTSVENEAMAYLPQSTASDICLEAACRLTERYDLPIVNLIHDAILAEIRPEEADEVAELMDKTMCEVAHEVTEGYVLFATEAKVGASWADV